MLNAVAMIASRVSRCLEWIAIGVLSPALFKGGIVAGMRRPSACSAPRPSKASRQHPQADGIIPLKWLLRSGSDRSRTIHLTTIQTGGQFASRPSSFSAGTSQHRLNGYVPGVALAGILANEHRAGFELAPWRAAAARQAVQE